MTYLILRLHFVMLLAIVNVVDLIIWLIFAVALPHTLPIYILLFLEICASKKEKEVEVGLFFRVNHDKTCCVLFRFLYYFMYAYICVSSFQRFVSDSFGSKC